MIHAYFRRRLSQHLDGSLAAPARARVERHLAGCESCRRELAELRGTVSLLRSLAVEEPAAGFTERVLARIATGEASPSRWERYRTVLVSSLGSSWTPAFASVAVLVVAAALLRVEVDVTLPFAGQERRDPVPTSRAPFQLDPSPTSPVSAIAPLSQVSSVSPPLATRRRFDPISLWHASGLRRACLASPNDAQCHGFHQQMMSLALEDTPAFIDEVDSVPSAPRERLLRVLSSEAARTGSAARIVSRLHATPDPRAVGIVVRFERPVASRD
jgi:hypothetical protein